MSPTLPPLPSITLKHFYPFNEWKIHDTENAPHYQINLGGGQYQTAEYQRDENGKEQLKTEFKVLKPNTIASGEPMCLEDVTTNTFYANESKGMVRFKCVLLALGTPIYHAIASIVNIAYKILKLITLSHFWRKKEENHSFTARLKDAGADLLRIVATPFAIISLEFSSIFGSCSPYNGRKLYATFERALYGNHRLAPCFQPGTTPENFQIRFSHFFGGNTKTRNSY